MDPAVTRAEVRFSSGAEVLVGNLVLPDGDGPHPVILSVAGTGQQNRDGDQVMPDGTVTANPRNRWIGDRLAAAGIAQLGWDKRGVGASTGGDRSPGDPPGIRDSHASPKTDVEDLLAALAFLDAHPDIDSQRIAVMGHSAGVYFACLAAARTNLPAAYVLWGGVHMPIDDLARTIYDFAASYGARGPAEHRWMAANVPGYDEPAKRWPAVLAAAQAGADVYRWEDERGDHVEYLTRLKEELEDGLGRQFANVKAPVMVIHGDQDLNVDVSEAHAAADAIRNAGNHDVTLTIVPGATHGMRVLPAHLSEDERMRNRFARHRDDPYSEYFIGSVIGWFRDIWVRYPGGGTPYR